jgi:hypothetical protein
VLWKVPFKTFYGILSSSILIIWPAHPSLLIFISSTMFKSLYRVYSSLFHLGRQRPPSCIGPYILRSPHTGLKVTKYVNLFHTRKQNQAKKPISRNDGHAELYADISKTNRPRKGVLRRGKEERNILRTIKNNEG